LLAERIFDRWVLDPGADEEIQIVMLRCLSLDAGATGEGFQRHLVEALRLLGGQPAERAIDDGRHVP
jgi:hypothetical protein